VEYLCQHVNVTLGQPSYGQSYAIVCPNLTYLWRHSLIGQKLPNWIELIKWFKEWI